MSSLTRSGKLTAAVQAIVRGKMSATRAEEERPEDVEDDIDPAAEEEDISPDADGEEDDTSAEDDDPETEAEADETETEAEDQGEEDKSMSRKASARIRRAEQGRIKAILTHPQAQANHGLAMELAFGKTFYSAEKAGALLKSSAGGGSGLSSRMAGKSPKLGAGPGAQPTAKQALLDATRNRIQAMHGRNRKGA